VHRRFARRDPRLRGGAACLRRRDRPLQRASRSPIGSTAILVDPSGNRSIRPASDRLVRQACAPFAAALAYIATPRTDDAMSNSKVFFGRESRSPALPDETRDTRHFIETPMTAHHSLLRIMLDQLDPTVHWILFTVVIGMLLHLVIARFGPPRAACLA
jgi:hypothetical protein